MTDELARIKQLRESPQKTAIAGFNEIVNNVLGSVDELITLADHYQQGNDIESQLKAKKLTLQPFLHLLRIRDLASTGTVLDREWTDVYSILAQVQKFRQYDVWRKEEGTLTLGPDYFKLSLAETQPFELPRWRATQQARQSWQATLGGPHQPEADVDPGTASRSRCHGGSHAALASGCPARAASSKLRRNHPQTIRNRP